MSETRQISAADLRAEIARARTPRYVIAALAGMHPATLGLLLNEWKPLPGKRADRILAAIKEAQTRERERRVAHADARQPR